MIWELSWSFVAEHRDLKALHWQSAARVCGALMRLAESGQGSVVQIERGDPNRFRLRAPGAVALLFVDTRARTIHVVRVLRND